MENLKVRGKVLEDKSGQFLDQEKGNLVVYSQCLAQIGTKVLKLKCAKEVAVKDHVGKDVTFELELRAGKDYVAELRVIAITK